MTDKTIRSGPDIVKEFVCQLKDDAALDKDTVDMVIQLCSESKLSQTKLQQSLALKRKAKPS